MDWDGQVLTLLNKVTGDVCECTIKVEYIDSDKFSDHANILVADLHYLFEALEMDNSGYSPNSMHAMYWAWNYTCAVNSWGYKD